MLSNKAMGAAKAVEPAYVEEVFSTYLYTGTGAAQTINNGIDLAGKGGLTWIKARTQPSFASNHALFDTARGSGKYLLSDAASAQATDNGTLSSFNANGFSLGVDSGAGIVNWSGHTFASWTFRKQPKFFDVVTFTAPASGSLTVNHNLGSAPGFITVKRTDLGASWITYHRSTGAGKYLSLNTTNAAATFAPIWANVTSTSFQVSVDAEVDANGTYVAYLFAHDAGGFGLSGNENVVSCGSFTTSGTGDPNAIVNLGYEPQWVMLKKTNGIGNWIMYDTMRGLPAAGATSFALYANLSNSEGGNNAVKLTSVGFNADTGNDAETYIYIAIRRGPMKVPTDGTKVYNAVARSGTGAAATVTGVGFTPDLAIIADPQSFATGSKTWWDRLRGSLRYLDSTGTFAEATSAADETKFDIMDGVKFVAGGGLVNYSPANYINWFFRRAPSFFDEVCYTGTGSAMTVAHNLGVAPELMIVKDRQPGGKSWQVYSKSLTTPSNYNLRLNTTDAELNQGATVWGAISSTSFGVTTGLDLVASGFPYVAYLFATCPGVSKVGSYTGTGTSQVINCGFTAGARFVMIKRTDSTGGWYVWDSARGIVAGNDPYLLLNSTAAEVTGTDYIDPSSAGFEISSTAPAAINASGGSYIFLAVA